MNPNDVLKEFLEFDENNSIPKLRITNYGNAFFKIFREFPSVINSHLYIITEVLTTNNYALMKKFKIFTFNFKIIQFYFSYLTFVIKT